MADIAALKAQKQELIAKRDAIKEERASDFEYVRMIKAKSKFKINNIIWAAVIAVVLIIGATLAVGMLMPESTPMLMWLTVGIPAVAAIAYTIVLISLHEKYTTIYKELDRNLSDVRLEIFNCERQIEKIDAELAAEN